MNVISMSVARMHCKLKHYKGNYPRQLERDDVMDS